MKILHVVPRYWPYVGGSERWFQEVSERLVRDGHQVTVLTTNAWDLEYFWNPTKKAIPVREEVHNGVRIRRLPVRHLPFSPLVYPATRRVMCWLARLSPRTKWALFPLCTTTPLVPSLGKELFGVDNGYQAVHAATIPFDSLVYTAQRYARKKAIPFILSPQTHLGETESDEVRRHYTLPHQIEMMRRSDFVIVRTDIERGHLEKLGVPAHKMVKVPAGADPREAVGQDSQFREKHGLKGPIVFSIGAMAYDKGTPMLLEAMKLLWREGLEASLVLAGPIMEPFSRDFAAQPLEVKKRCLVLGFVSQEEKLDLLEAGDVFAMPSRTDSFGIVYLEAWLHRKPVIGAWAGGIPEVIAEGEDGFLVRFGDVPALAWRIRQLLEDRDLARRMGAKGREKTLQHYTWDKVYERVAPLYNGLLERTR